MIYQKLFVVSNQLVTLCETGGGVLENGRTSDVVSLWIFWILFFWNGRSSVAISVWIFWNLPLKGRTAVAYRLDPLKSFGNGGRPTIHGFFRSDNILVCLFLTAKGACRISQRPRFQCGKFRVGGRWGDRSWRDNLPPRLAWVPPTEP